MSWLLISLVGYFLNAISTLISKWLLLKDIPQPVVFTFYAGILNLFGLLLIPFGFFWAGTNEVLIALASGATFGLGLYYLAKALRFDQVSQVAPLVGGLQPIFVSLFAWWLISEKLALGQYLGIAIIISGSILIALEFNKKNFFTASVKFIFSSAIFFALSYVLLDLSYSQQGFVNGFVWSRIGMFLFVLVLAFRKNNWKIIKKSYQKSLPKSKAWYLVGQVAGALSFVLVAYAISLGPVTIINSLQGIQYVFLFLFIVLLMRKHPHLLDEPWTRPIVVQKIIAIFLIVAGLALVV